VSLDFLLCGLNRVGQSCYFEDGLLVSRRSDDVGVGLLLDALDGRSFRANDEPHDSVGNPHLDRSLTGNVGIGSVRSRDSQSSRSHSRSQSSSSTQVVLSLCSNLAEVFCCRQDLSLCRGNILLSSSYYEYGLLSSNGSFDVCVCLGSQSLDFASCVCLVGSECVMLRLLFPDAR
jgi:hypothetical protein